LWVLCVGGTEALKLAGAKVGCAGGGVGVGFGEGELAAAAVASAKRGAFRSKVVTLEPGR